MISVILPVKNVAGILRRCLDAVRFADEILLVDGNSTDGTLEIAAQYPNVRILQHASNDIRLLVAETEPLARNPWIYWLAADEVVTPELAQELSQRCGDAPSDIGAFLVPCIDILFGVEWGPGASWPRVWRNGAAKFAFKRWHEMPVIAGRVETLRHPYWHISNPNIRTLVPKFLRYEYVDAQNASDDDCLKVNDSFWYQLLRYNYYAVVHYWGKRKLGFPATANALTCAFGQLLRHLLMVEELRIRRGLTTRDTQGW